MTTHPGLAIAAVFVIACGGSGKSVPTRDSGTTQDRDGDGFAIGDGDCDDSDPGTHPGAPEAARDGVDSDCDGIDGSARTVGLDAVGTLDGTVPGAGLGYDVAAGPQLTVSGSGTFAVAAPGIYSGGGDASAGALTLARVEGDGLSVSCTFEGSAPGDLLSRHLAVSTDVTGDGLEDVWASARDAVYIFSGCTAGLVASIRASEDARMGAVRHLDNSALIATAPFGANPGPNTVWLLSGPFAGSMESTEGDVAFEGTAGDPTFGTSLIEVVGDVDGDGVVDVALGSEVAGLPYGGEGAVFVVPAVSVGAVGVDALADPWVGDAPQQISRLFAFGDLTGDGTVDLGVGGVHDTGGQRSGALAILSGPPGDVPRSLQEADATLIGEEDWDWMGWRAAPAGDLDQDGFDDLLVGAPGDPYHAMRPGRVHLVYGPVEGVLAASDLQPVWRGRDPGDGLGSGMAAVGVGGDVRLLLGSGTRSAHMSLAGSVDLVAW